MELGEILRFAQDDSQVPGLRHFAARYGYLRVTGMRVSILYGARPTVVGFRHAVYSETCSEASGLVKAGEIPSFASGQALRCSFASLRTFAQDDTPKFPMPKHIAGRYGHLSMTHLNAGSPAGS